MPASTWSFPRPRHAPRLNSGPLAFPTKPSSIPTRTSSPIPISTSSSSSSAARTSRLMSFSTRFAPGRASSRRTRPSWRRVARRSSMPQTPMASRSPSRRRSAAEFPSSSRSSTRSSAMRSTPCSALSTVRQITCSPRCSMDWTTTPFSSVPRSSDMPRPTPRPTSMGTTRPPRSQSSLPSLSTPA